MLSSTHPGVLRPQALVSPLKASRDCWRRSNLLLCLGKSLPDIGDTIFVKYRLSREAGREVGEGARGSREVLQDDAGRFKGHFYVLVLHDIPVQDVFNVVLLHQELIAVPNGGLQENSDGKRQAPWEERQKTSHKTSDSPSNRERG